MQLSGFNSCYIDLPKYDTHDFMFFSNKTLLTPYSVEESTALCLIDNKSF